MSQCVQAAQASSEAPARSLAQQPAELLCSPPDIMLWCATVLMAVGCAALVPLAAVGEAPPPTVTCSVGLALGAS